MWVQNKRLISRAFYASLFLGSCLLVYLLRSLFITIVLATILIYLLYPVIKAMVQRGTPKLTAIFLAYMGLVIISLGIGMYVLPRLYEQLNLLASMLPIYAIEMNYWIENVKGFYQNQLPIGVGIAIDQQLVIWEENLERFIAQFLSSLVNLISYTMNLFLAPVIAFYILKDMDDLKCYSQERIYKHLGQGAIELLRQINGVINNFIRGDFLLVLIVGSITSIVLALIGLDYAVMFGIISGLAELIPYFGPFIGAIPAVAFALLLSQWLAVKVVLAIFLVQQLEGNFIAPRILGDSVGLHPLMIILALVAGGELFGLWGILLAVPGAAVLRVIILFVGNKIEAGTNEEE